VIVKNERQAEGLSHGGGNGESEVNLAMGSRLAASG
jgi:hypothetical protein